MPWMVAYMPSIQLATVKSVINKSGIDSDVYEFYLDYVAEVGSELYSVLNNISFVLAEKVFAPFAFPGFVEAHRFPSRPTSLGNLDPDVERLALYFLQPLSRDYLCRCLGEIDWARYDVVCFSLTTVQTTSSIALAQAIRKKAPHITIIFGGTSCAGDMGCALAELCDAVDIVVHGEAETTLPPIIDARRSGSSLACVPGITYRENGTHVTTEKSRLLALQRGFGELQ
jgi:hypothetical protein